MKRILFLTCGLALVAGTAAALPEAAKADKAAVTQHKPVAEKQKLTVAQIVTKNVAARGGLKAWHAVNTLILSGRMEAGGKSNADLPFVMKMERPRMSRLEIRFQGQTAVQVFDGEHGWKVRPFLGRNEVEPFTPAETRVADAWGELDGPLVDYARKGIRVELQGRESVEGHSTYKLELTMKNGDKRHVWIDAANFLERKIEGDPRMLDGRMRNVAIFYRDYKTENGLTTPRVFETAIEGGKQHHKMYIERVAVNQPMEKGSFSKPQLALASTPVQRAE
ncbi:MAG TPA: outer membrane lipoprotein-sorting protein [Gallionellaceae bacterium]